MNAPPEIAVIQEPDLAIVKISGEMSLKVATVDHEFTRLQATRPKAVILDLSGLTFCSSLGMGLFVHLHNTLKRFNGRLFAFGIPPRVLDSFRRSRLDSLFEIRDSLEAALFSAGHSGEQPPPARAE